MFGGLGLAFAGYSIRSTGASKSLTRLDDHPNLTFDERFR